jgi:hypothetical protein
MRITSSLIVLSVVACACTLRAAASEDPQAHLEGLRCELTTLPGFPNTVILVCSADDGDPIGHSGSRVPSSTNTDAELGSQHRPGLSPKRLLRSIGHADVRRTP